MNSKRWDYVRFCRACFFTMMGVVWAVKSSETRIQSGLELYLFFTREYLDGFCREYEYLSALMTSGSPWGVVLWVYAGEKIFGEVQLRRGGEASAWMWGTDGTQEDRSTETSIWFGEGGTKVGEAHNLEQNKLDDALLSFVRLRFPETKQTTQ